jgi:hypothetical protein
MASSFAAPSAMMQPRSFKDFMTRLVFVEEDIVYLEEIIRTKRMSSQKGKDLITIYRLLADDVSDANKAALHERRKELEMALDAETKLTTEYLILTIERRQRDAIKAAMESQFGPGPF